MAYRIPKVLHLPVVMITVSGPCPTGILQVPHLPVVTITVSGPCPNGIPQVPHLPVVTITVSGPNGIPLLYLAPVPMAFRLLQVHSWAQLTNNLASANR